MTVVLVVAGLLLTHLLQSTGPVGDASYLVAVWGAAVVAWIGATRRPGRSGLVPHLIAAGLTVSAVGDLIWTAYFWRGQAPDVSLADAAYFSAYVALGAALLIITVVRTRAGWRVDADAVVDALTIIVISILIFWDLSIAGIVADTSVSAPTRVVWATYPVLDAILLALVARALVSRGLRSSANLCFAVGIACWLVGDIGNVVFTGSQSVTAVLDAGWMLGAMLMMAAAWPRPEADTVEPATDDLVSRRALLKLGIGTVPLLVPLVLESVTHARGSDGHPTATLVSMALLLALTFVRSARLLQSESRARTEARAARDDALEASRAKSAFLATMSHEIRTPMNGVIGLTGLLQGTELDQRQRQYVDGVHVAGESLLRIINDILDFSKVEAGKLELDIVDFDLVQVVEEAVELVAESARDKGLELLASCSPALPQTIRGDPSRLRQVLLNLASNAVKFTEAGEVVVRAHLEDQSSRGPVVRFEVIDTGIGLEVGDRQRLFEPFSQADSSTTRRFGGTGLGLAICRQLVTLMGGTIGVDSEVGRGSSFWFKLPLEYAAVSVEPGPTPDVLAGLRVLVVDDNDTSRLLLSERLTAWRMRADTSPDGSSALRLIREAVEAGSPYRLALVDLHMPGMGGLELARQVSQRPGLAGIGLVLLTSQPDVAVERAADTGIGAQLTKPLQLSRLRGVLEDVVGSTAGAQSSSSLPAARRSRSRGHVLVVEDNHVNQMVAVGILEHLGYSTEVAGNGIEALVSVARTPFAAVVMDCQMPEMDGFTATRGIRRLEGAVGRRTPVIAMTAGVTEGDRERCLEAGMDDFVAKPVSRLELDAALSRWLPASLT